MRLNCERIHKLIEALDRPSGVQVMEVCGTHTMAVARSGLRSLLPDGLRLTSGPGCPVCVTDQSYMDQAVVLAGLSEVTITTYGDMVRVPGRHGSLADARASGAKVEVVYSADDAVSLATSQQDRQVVFLGVGFETTTPATALAVLRAKADGLKNFSVLSAHKLMIPAMRALLDSEQVAIDGYLCPGHVSVILGYEAYADLARDFHRPCVVAGFDPGQVVAGLEEILRQIAADDPKASTVYPSVSAQGNAEARKVSDAVFAPSDAPWRALGVIPGSGLAIRPEFAEFDAVERFDLPEAESYEMPGCRCGDVICGRCSPADCELFATRCTPRDPIGPCMVSAEGACAAAYKYERR